jgi:hypothetical protein
VKINDPETVAFLAESLRTADAGLRGRFLSQLMGAHNSPAEEPTRKLKDLLPLLHAIGPKNELEVMLGIQMIAVHNFGLRCLNIANQPEQDLEIGVALTNMANKLLRTFTLQVDALNRLKGNGGQKVIVEHVHVHEGGQAIVGQVNTSKGKTRGEGDND